MKVSYNKTWSLIPALIGIVLIVIGGGHRNLTCYAGGALILISGVPLVVAGIWNMGKESGWWGR